MKKPSMVEFFTGINLDGNSSCTYIELHVDKESSNLVSVKNMNLLFDAIN